MAPSAVTTTGTTQQNQNSLPAPLKLTEQPTSATDSPQYHASSTREAIESEETYAAHNYHPLPIVFARALGTSVWDPEGKVGLDWPVYRR